MHNQHAKLPSDVDLWERLKQGDEEALKTLFLRHHDLLYRYGMTMCSTKQVIEDCLQELFFQLWNTHAHLSKVKKVKAYLWTSFRRMLMKKLTEKQKNAHIFNSVSSVLDELQTKQNAETMIIKQEQQTENQKALAKSMRELTERERQVLFLKYYDGMSYEEIEDILGIRYQTARNYMHRAIANLRAALKHEIVSTTLTLLFIFLSLAVMLID